MFKGNKNKQQKINGLYYRSKIKHHGFHLFWFDILDDLSNIYDISLEQYYSSNGLEFKSKTNFIKKLRLSQKLNNTIRIK